MRHREDAEFRILRHARQGFGLAMSDPEYLATVRERLAPSLELEPTNLWQAIDWTWAVALGQVSVGGPLAEPIQAAAVLLRELLSADDGASQRWLDATGGQLSLGSTLSSHPFPDLASWFIRKTSLAS